MVKEDCATCQMIAPLAAELEQQGLLEAAFSQGQNLTGLNDLGGDLPDQRRSTAINGDQRPGCGSLSVGLGEVPPENALQR